MWICEKCKFWTEFFIITKKDKVYFLIVIKKTKHTFYSSLQKKDKSTSYSIIQKKDKAHFLIITRLAKASCEPCKHWAILKFKPCFTHGLPCFEFMVLNLKIQKKGDEITTLNSRRHLCQACSLLLCLFLWQPCKHRPLRLRH